MKKTIQTVNMHEAKTQLSKLVDKASKGEPFIIARAGKPLVKVIPVDAPVPEKCSDQASCRGTFAIPARIWTSICSAGPIGLALGLKVLSPVQADEGETLADSFLQTPFDRILIAAGDGRSVHPFGSAILRTPYAGL